MFKKEVQQRNTRSVCQYVIESNVLQIIEKARPHTSNAQHQKYMGISKGRNVERIG